jgi:hypothetical protein
MYLDEQQESHKDQRKTSSDELFEQKAVLHQIKGLSHVHKAGIDIIAIAQCA